MDSSNEANRQIGGSSVGKERRRIRGLWIGLVIWILILLNAIRIAPLLIARGFPRPIFILAVVVDATVAIVTLGALRSSYRKLKSRKDSSDQTSQGNFDG